MAGRPEKKKKKLLGILLAVFIVSGGLFVFSDVKVAAAAKGENCVTTKGSFWGCVGNNLGLMMDGAAAAAAYPFKVLLYGIFVFASYLVSVAVTIFGWAINPEHISGPGGFFNRPVVYELWKFIRDFFNLFFILVLLYIAFTLVFQIQKNFKQALLSLVLAALLVNFSFPVSRFMIDVTNVPMYFFANEITDKKNLSSRLGGVFSMLPKYRAFSFITMPQRKAEEVQRIQVKRFL